MSQFVPTRKGFSLAYLDDWSKFDALNFNCMLISVRGWFLMEKRGALFPKVGMLEGYVKSSVWSNL